MGVEREEVASCQRDAQTGRRRRFAAPLCGQEVGEFDRSTGSRDASARDALFINNLQAVGLTSILIGR